MASKINLNQHDPFDFQLIRENHFSHVRLGSRVWQYVGSSPNFTIDATKLQQYKNAVDWALAEGLMVIVNPIHYWRDYEDADLPMLIKMEPKMQILTSPKQGVILQDLVMRDLK